MAEAVVAQEVLRYRGTTETVEDKLVVEEPIEIRLSDVPLAVVMRTPGDDADLVLGFAITEGIVPGPEAVSGVRSLGEGRWSLDLAEGFSVDPDQFKRNFYATSSCGVCGKASIDAIRVAGSRPPPGPVVGAETILTLPPLLLERQAAFHLTGGLHAVGAFDSSGNLVAVREDVGRHNAVDKVIGFLAKQGWPLPPLGLLVSGRVSFEIVQKAAVAGISLVCGVSAASSLAVELGEEFGMTVIGFLRDDGFTVYSGAERVEGVGA